eukprot:1034357-Pyramimonas_sp.AAC.1
MTVATTTRTRAKTTTTGADLVRIKTGPDRLINRQRGVTLSQAQQERLARASPNCGTEANHHARLRRR